MHLGINDAQDHGLHEHRASSIDRFPEQVIDLGSTPSSQLPNPAVSNPSEFDPSERQVRIHAGSLSPLSRPKDRHSR